MSRVSRNKADRAKVFAKKWLQGVVQGLRPAAIRARSNGPKVFINSVPKAGTHLLEHALGLFPQLRFMGRPTIKHWTEKDLPKLEKVMKEIPKGAFRSGHLEYALELERLVDANGVKFIEVIRDPRDVVVSQWKYVTNIDLTHKEARALFGSSEQDKLLQMIKGIPDKIISLDQVWKMHKGWIDKPDVLVVKFEDLIGPKGGCSKQAQIATIKRIANYLGLTCNEEEISGIADGLFSETAATFRKGRAGNWVGYIEDKHKELLKEKIGDLLIELGYEESMDW